MAASLSLASLFRLPRKKAAASHGLPAIRWTGVRKTCITCGPPQRLRDRVGRRGWATMMTLGKNPTRGGKERILVVDDEQNARVALRTILAEEGYEVVEAADGEEALQLMPRLRPGGGAGRRADAAHGRHHAPEAGAGAGVRRGLRHDDRLRHRRGGGRGDAGRRRELPGQAARRERRAGGAREGAGEAAAAARHPEPARAGARALPLPQHRRRRAPSCRRSSTW